MNEGRVYIAELSSADRIAVSDEVVAWNDTIFNVVDPPPIVRDYCTHMDMVDIKLHFQCVKSLVAIQISSVKQNGPGSLHSKRPRDRSRREACEWGHLSVGERFNRAAHRLEVLVDALTCAAMYRMIADGKLPPSGCLVADLELSGLDTCATNLAHMVAILLIAPSKQQYTTTNKVWEILVPWMGAPPDEGFSLAERLAPFILPTRALTGRATYYVPKKGVAETKSQESALSSLCRLSREPHDSLLALLVAGGSQEPGPGANSSAVQRHDSGKTGGLA